MLLDSGSTASDVSTYRPGLEITFFPQCPATVPNSAFTSLTHSGPPWQVISHSKHLIRSCSTLLISITTSERRHLLLHSLPNLPLYHRCHQLINISKQNVHNLRRQFYFLALRVSCIFVLLCHSGSVALHLLHLSSLTASHVSCHVVLTAAS